MTPRSIFFLKITIARREHINNVATCLNLHVFIVQSIVMVNLNIYFAYFHFVLVSLCVFNQTNQI